MTDVANGSETKTDQNGVDLKDIAVSAGGGASAEPAGRKRVVWADTKNRKLTEKMVSSRLHYSVNYNSASFSSPVHQADDGESGDAGGAGDPPNPKIENCCIIS